MRKSIKIVIISIIGIFIIGTLYFFINNTDKLTQNENLNSQNNEFTVNKIKSGELSFINEKFGYSLIIPADWIANDFEDLGLVSFYVEDQIVNAELEQGMKIEISSNVKKSPISLENFVEQEESNIGKDNIIYKNNVLVDSIPVIEMASNVQGYSVVTYFNTEKYTYWIAIYMSDKSNIKKNVGIYHGIIDSLQFQVKE
ncbi:hypothetical protein KKC06_02470 [Patescibacteria group bacterium]|nr:hypothetical protein [Patescibacteria group bacterium]